MTSSPEQSGVSAEPAKTAHIEADKTKPAKRRAKPRGALRRYIDYRIEHTLDYCDRVGSAFFRPARLVVKLNFNSDHSFREAIDAALIGASIYALSIAITAALIGARLDESRLDQLLEEFIVLGIVLLLPLIFTFLRRGTSLDGQRYDRYLHCSAYFVSSIAIALAIFTSNVMLITYFGYGTAGDWGRTIKSPCAGETALMQCAMLTAHTHGAELAAGFMKGLQFSRTAMAYAFNVMFFFVLVSSALISHMIVLRSKLYVPYFYSGLFYLTFVITLFFVFRRFGL